MPNQQSQVGSEIATASRVLNDGRLVELVYDQDKAKTMLAVCDRGEVSLAEDISVSANERLIPISAANSLLRHKAIVLPQEPIAYGDVESLIESIDRHIARYVTLSDSFRLVAAYYVLFSWVYDAFEEVPYLRVQGEWGAGKTRALIVIGSLCHRAFLASGASTVSPIFHTLDTFRGTLVLDEADFRFSDQTTELTKILNNGNVRGFPVFRTAITQKREFDPRAFQVFGPKLIAMRGSFEDDALESRFITERLDTIQMALHIPISLPARQRTEAQELRNQLLQYRFDTRLACRSDESLVDSALSPRINQILVPLLSVVPDARAREEIKRVVLESERRRKEASARTIEADVVEALLDAMEDTGAPVPISAICSRLAARHLEDYGRPISGRYVGNIVRTKLGLSPYKSHGIYVVAPNEMHLQRLAERLGVRGPSDAAGT